MTSQPSQPAFSSPQAELLLRLLRVSDQLQRGFQLCLRPYALTHPQYNILRILRAAPAHGLTCSAIGRSMITAVPDITRLLGRLVERKLVSQHRDPSDRRVVWTHITPRGLTLLRKLDPIVEQAPLDLLHSLSSEQVQELNYLLQSIAAPGESLSPVSCPSARLDPKQLRDAEASSEIASCCPISPASVSSTGSSFASRLRRSAKRADRRPE
jgi:DNA-binding MarR family transcriptional regulator